MKTPRTAGGASALNRPRRSYSMSGPRESRRSLQWKGYRFPAWIVDGLRPLRRPHRALSGRTVNGDGGLAVDGEQLRWPAGNRQPSSRHVGLPKLRQALPLRS